MKKNVFILIGSLQKYRVPVFEELSKKYNLTIVCDNSNEYDTKELPFSLINCQINKAGPFLYHRTGVGKLSKNSDVVIGLLNIRFLDLFFYAINPFRRCKLILWGIGTNASYKKKFGSKDISFYLRIIMGFFSDALIFYSTYPIKYYKKFGVNEKKIFVANNTVAISSNDHEVCSTKDSFIFVGTIYKEKGLDVLIEEYYNAYLEIGNNLCDLVIVGGGCDLKYIQDKTEHLNIKNKVTFSGPIYDENELKEKFQTSLISISPNQAGLSVLKSMGYGVPFVTSVNALTGGERLNIEDGVNGCLFTDENELKKILIDASINKEKYLAMGRSARNYYESFRTVKHMAEGLSDAIEFVVRK